jgi:hypothetical protein
MIAVDRLIVLWNESGRHIAGSHGNVSLPPGNPVPRRRRTAPGHGPRDSSGCPTISFRKEGHHGKGEPCRAVSPV